MLYPLLIGDSFAVVVDAADSVIAVATLSVGADTCCIVAEPFATGTQALHYLGMLVVRTFAPGNTPPAKKNGRDDAGRLVVPGKKNHWRGGV